LKPELFLSDIEAKPASLRSLAALLDDGVPWPSSKGVKRVVFLGMGSSRYAADVVALRLRAAGLSAVAEYASAEASLPADPDTLAVAVSASGGSVETLRSASPYQGSGRLLALTNVPSSELADMADDVVLMHAGTEASGMATRSFAHTLVLLLDLAARLTGTLSSAADVARRAADATEDLLVRRDEWLPQTLDVLDGPDGVYAIAPAERLSSAMQSALMVREIPRRAATGCETGDWAHVDVYLTKTRDYRALFFPGSRYDEQALDWIKQRTSTLVSVGAPADGASMTIRYRGDDDVLTRLITEVLVAELVAEAWAR
jgi:fructoselysine-6-P-deglycase FrlB-like protein